MRNIILIIFASIQFFGCSLSLKFISTFTNKNNLNKEISKVLEDSIFSKTQIGIEVVSLTKGDILFSKNSNLLFHPASNQKLITSIALIDNFSSDENIPTRIYTDSISKNGTAYNIYLKGFGDPLFTANKLNLMILHMKNIGINNISGNIYADISFFDDGWGNGWMWTDEPYYYAAYTSPLTIEQNSVKVIVKPNLIGEKPIVSLIPETEFIEIKNNAITTSINSKSKIEISRNSFDRNNVIIIEGDLPVSKDSIFEHISVINPEKYFLSLFKNKLINNEITFNGDLLIGETKNNSKLISEHLEPIDTIISFLNKTSDNLSGENMLKHMSSKIISVPGSTKKGIWLLNKSLSKNNIDTNSIIIVDGSGMSNYNLNSAKNFVTLLKSIYNQPTAFSRLYNSLPIAGVDGTLKSRMVNTNAKNNLRAKTGTHSGMCTLTGFVKSKNGEVIAFSIMIQNYIGSAQKYRNAQDLIGEILANFNR